MMDKSLYQDHTRFKMIPHKGFYFSSTTVINKLFHEKNIYLHEKKYLSSREKIFLFMKKNIYYRDNKTLTTVVYHFLPPSSSYLISLNNSLKHAETTP